MYAERARARESEMDFTYEHKKCKKQKFFTVRFIDFFLTVIRRHMCVCEALENSLFLFYVHIFIIFLFKRFLSALAFTLDSIQFQRFVWGHGEKLFCLFQTRLF
jgi:hypothetical protein